MFVDLGLGKHNGTQAWGLKNCVSRLGQLDTFGFLKVIDNSLIHVPSQISFGQHMNNCHCEYNSEVLGLQEDILYLNLSGLCLVKPNQLNTGNAEL